MTICQEINGSTQDPVTYWLFSALREIAFQSFL